MTRPKLVLFKRVESKTLVFKKTFMHCLRNRNWTYLHWCGFNISQQPHIFNFAINFDFIVVENGNNLVKLDLVDARLQYSTEKYVVTYRLFQLAKDAIIF